MIDVETIMRQVREKLITNAVVDVFEKSRRIPKTPAKHIQVSVVDSKSVSCKFLKHYYSGHIDNDIEIGSILLLALRMYSPTKVLIKNYTMLFVSDTHPVQYFIGEYLSNELCYSQTNKQAESKIIVNPTDDFFTTSIIDASNRIYIFPLVFKDLSNPNVVNFSDIVFGFCDYEGNTYHIKVNHKSCMKNNKYIDQRLVIGSVGERVN